MTRPRTAQHARASRPFAARPLWTAAATLAAAVACLGCQLNSHKDPSMPPTPFTEFGLDPKPVAAPEPRRIVPLTQPARAASARPSPSDPDGALQPFANAQRNSRLPASLPAAESWDRAVTVPIAEDFIPHGLVASDRVVVLSTPMGLLAFGPDGKQIGGRIDALTDGVIAPTQSHVLCADSNGFIAGHPLAAGAPRFQLSPSFGNVYRRDFFAFLGGRLVVVGQKSIPPVERRETEPPKPEAIIDAWDWPETIKTDEDGYADNAPKVRSIITPTPTLAAAAVGEALVVAVPDHIYTIDRELNVQSDLTGEFYPLALSCDSHGRIYLIARGTPAGRLLVITPDARQLFATDLPPPPRGGYAPPIVGYDHTIYIPTEDRIVVLDSSGKAQPPIPIQGRFAGAAVTADHHLLVASGDRLVAHTVGAEPTVIAEFPGEAVRTAPVLLRSGVIWIATDRNLYALKPVPRQ
jgi:hypothetical protein